MSQPKAQILLEVLIGVTLLGIVLTALVLLYSSVIKVSRFSIQSLSVKSLIDDYREKIGALSYDNWLAIENLATNTEYRIVISGDQLNIEPGRESLVQGGFNLQRWFTVEYIFRDLQGNLSSAGYRDYSSQKITVFVLTPEREHQDSFIIVKPTQKIVFQRLWGGGPTGDEVVKEFTNDFASSSFIQYETNSIKLQLQ